MRSDKEWESKWDAETLAQAETIKADPNRMANAKNAAVKMAQEQEDNARAMKKVAGQKIRTSKKNPTGNQSKNYTLSNMTEPSVGGPFNVFKRI